MDHRHEPFGEVLRGDAARAYLSDRIAGHERDIDLVLAPYHPVSAVQSWRAEIRAAEEMINAPRFSIESVATRRQVAYFPIQALLTSGAAQSHLKSLLRPWIEPDAVERITLMAMKMGALGSAHDKLGITAPGDGVDLQTFGGAMAFLQARRRHFGSIYYRMPTACRGRRPLLQHDGMNVFAPIVELICSTLSDLHQQRALLEIHPDFALFVDGDRYGSTHDFYALEGDFLEPERASVAVMARLRRDQIVDPDLEPVEPTKVFSAAELRNATLLLEVAYAAYDLADAAFRAACQLIIAFSRHAKGDYYIDLPREQFDAILSEQPTFAVAELEALLVAAPSSYTAATNAWEPFIAVGGQMITNVNLLSRFLYSFTNRRLESRRRFTIHAGFIFEEVVKDDLEALGWRITGIKRLNHQEFDVVAVRAGVVMNVQCKNNAIDLAMVDANPRLFARYNRRLVSYYRRALAKERRREGLLQDHLAVEDIRHVVVSRFPVVADHPDIVPYNRLARVFA